MEEIETDTKNNFLVCNLCILASGIAVPDQEKNDKENKPEIKDSI